LAVRKRTHLEWESEREQNGSGDNRRHHRARLRQRRRRVHEERGRAVHGAGPQQRRRPVAVGAPHGVRVHAPHRDALRHRRGHSAGEARDALRLHLRQVRRRPERYRGPPRVPRGDEEDHARHSRRPRLLPYPYGPRRRPQ